MPVELMQTMKDLKEAFDLFRSAIGLAKDAKDLLPGSTSTATQEAITQSLDQAERASRLAEAQMAKLLGYHLCQCTFPPQIMLSIGERRRVERFECPSCKKTYPPDHWYENNSGRSGPSSWMGV